MPRHDLKDFTWMGEPLPDPPDWADGVEYEEVTPLELTTWLVDKFRVSKQREVVRLLDETQVVRRLFSPIEVQEGWSKTDADWDTDSPAHALGIAMYIFCENRAADKCSTCKHYKSIGPGEECIVDKNGRVQGACTNCYYKGRGGTCHHRVQAEEAEARKRKWEESKAKLGDRLPERKKLSEMSEGAIRDWISFAQDEIEIRRLKRKLGITSE